MNSLNAPLHNTNLSMRLSHSIHPSIHPSSQPASHPSHKDKNKNNNPVQCSLLCYILLLYKRVSPVATAVAEELAERHLANRQHALTTLLANPAPHSILLGEPQKAAKRGHQAHCSCSTKTYETDDAGDLRLTLLATASNNFWLLESLCPDQGWLKHLNKHSTEHHSALHCTPCLQHSIVARCRGAKAIRSRILI